MIGKLFAYAGDYRRTMLYSVLCTAGEVLCELFIPFFMSLIVDRGIPGRDVGYIAVIGAIMIGMALVAIAFGLLNIRFSSISSQGFAANLRKALFQRATAFSFANIDAFSSASLVTRMTSDVTQLQLTLMMGLRMLTRAPLMLICALAISIGINARLSLVVVISIVLLLSCTLLIMKCAQKYFRVMQTRLDALNARVQENLTAIRVVKAFVREDYEKARFSEVNDELMEAAITAGNISALIMPVMLLVLNGTTIAVIWLGGTMVSAGNMGTGELMSFISYIMQILMSVMIFSMILMAMARARASAERAVEVLDTVPGIVDAPSAEEQGIRVKNGRIEFRDVSFKYCDGPECEEVLKDISFVAEPGDIVGILGETGSGKTSLVNLIPRFYDATEGLVLVGGRSVREYDQHVLRDAIGMVLQKNNLFSGTIRENILWGNPEASMDEVVEAARAAQAHDFIMAFPAGYETYLGQGGVNLSGGQKQRICIARAMLKRPKILILDDSTSAVDTATETKIRQAFQDDFKDATVLIVAQRISSVQDADSILVIEDGRIRIAGTHEELMERDEAYREVYNSQNEGRFADGG